MPTSVTQRDVAQACGLHPSTVCLALKNSPSIPLETRRRIQGVAEELGYQPNVAARNLAMLRTEKKTGGSLPIGWINQEARRDHWRTDPEARVYFDGATRRAQEHGFHLEEIWTREPGMTTARIVQIIAARGIEGVVFPSHRSFDFTLLNHPWSDFALVGFNDQRLGAWFDVVCPDYFRNLQLVLRQLEQLQYQRIGLVLTSQLDAATNGLVHGCYLRYEAESSRASLPVCFAPDQPERARAGLAKWMREFAPDAVVCPNRELAEFGRCLGHGVPWVQLHGSLAEFDGGVDDGPAEIAATAVDCVVEKMRRFERGTSEASRLYLLAGSWQERSLGTRVELTSVA